MTVVILVLPSDGLQSKMNAMRTWLDARRCEASQFELQAMSSGHVAKIKFNVQTDAHAFASEFGGKLTKAAMTP